MKRQEEIITRLKKIFDIFLRENFATTNNVYFEKLLTHLQAKENEFIVQESLSLDWIHSCLTLVTEDINRVHPKVISFMLNFCSYLASNEWVILKLKERNIIFRTIQFMQTHSHEFTPSIKLGFVRLMATVSQYSMGMFYIRQNGAWSLLIEYSNNEHTLYVVREARQLLYQLLYKYSTKMKDDAIVLEILKEILKPIHENIFNLDDEHITIRVDDTELQHKLASTLDLLSYILQQTLESEEKTNLTHLLKEHHNIHITMYKLTEMTQDSFFRIKIMETLTSFNYATLVYEKLHNPETSGDADNFNEFGLNFFNMMKCCVERADGMAFIKLAELYHILWKKLGKHAPKEIVIENQRVLFENQLICLHMMLLFFSMKNHDEMRGEIFDSYLMKLFDITCEQTHRICYSLRDAFCTIDGSLTRKYTADLFHKCIHSLLSLVNILEREQAVVVCQTLLYMLKEIVMLHSSENHQSSGGSCTFSVPGYRELYPLGSEIILQDPKVLHAVMVGLQKLIERFKITWKESVETIGLVNCVAFILEKSNLDARSTVQALKLVQLAIEHFLSPNMALLVDSLEGSGLLCVGPIIAKRLHDNHWEVRDTALELTTSIADISRLKFPAFQRFLVDFKLPPIVCEMVKHDCEPYVRASAFKCLSKMVSINMIWENDLSQLDLVDHLLYVLYNENEDMVRIEAIHTLSVIYEKRKIPLKYKDTLFSTLNYCVVGDHHWEVKINALCFWKTEFHRQLQNQGMIDGVFPSVTFSKEHKKIVTLTEREIKLRMAKVLVEVQHYGYFGILLKCLKDEYATEVTKLIITGIHLMFEKLQKYGLESIINEVDALTIKNDNISSSSNFTNKPLTPPPSVESTVNNEESDEVIDAILESKDIHLLEKAFETQMEINNCSSSDDNDKKRHIDEFLYKQYAITLREYIDAVRQVDLDQLMNQQDEWLQTTESFISLLDDFLFAIKRDDENMVSDCY